MNKAKKTVNITWTDDGEILIETDGYVGTKCLDALKELEKHFGMAESIKMKKGLLTEANHEKSKA